MAKVTFTDAPKLERDRRPWYEIHTKAATTCDETLVAFLEAYGNEPEGFKRAVNGFNIELGKTAENALVRNVRCLNERAKILELPVHARQVGDKLILQTGVKVVHKRTVKPKEEATA